MRCPYCRTALTELTSECPGCQLNLSRATALLGPVPRIENGVSDHCEAFTPKERKDLLQRVHALQERFPQVRLQVLCHHFPDTQPFPLYVFWIFNMGGISRDPEKAGHNRTILLVLDPLGHKSALTVGYGLEPFLTEAALDQVLELASPAWTDQAWAEGTTAAIDGLGALLDTAAHTAAEAFQLPVSPRTRIAGEF